LPPGILKLFGCKKQPEQHELSIKQLKKAVTAGALNEQIINS